MNIESLIQLSKQPSEFLKKIKENIILEDDSNDLFDSIAKAYNEGGIELLEIIINDDKKTPNLSNYEKSKLIEIILPKIKPNISEANKIVDFCVERSLYIKSGSYNNFFANIATDYREVDKNETLIKWITEKPTERKNIITPLLLSKKSISEVETLKLLMPLIKSGEESIIQKCLYFLDCNFINDPKILNELNILTTGEYSEEIKGIAIFCLINFAKEGEASSDEIIKKLTEHIKENDILIKILSQKKDLLSDDVKLFLYKKIKKDTLISNDNINLIDFIIHEIIISEKIDIAVDFLETIAERGDNAVKLCNLSSISHELVKNENIFKGITTKWFTENKDHLLTIIDSIQNKIANFDKFNFKDPSIITDNLDDNKLVKIIVRCSGWFFFRPRLAFSFIFPIYENLSEISKSKVHPLIEETFLFNYPLNLEEYIKNFPDYCLSKKISMSINERKTNIEKSWSIREFKSSSSLVVEFDRSTYKEMESIHKEANKKSILAQLFTPLHILYGNGTIHYVEGINTPPVRQESMMGTIKHSFENPAMMVTDPIGLEMLIVGNKFGELK